MLMHFTDQALILFLSFGYENIVFWHDILLPFGKIHLATKHVSVLLRDDTDFEKCTMNAVNLVGLKLFSAFVPFSFSSSLFVGSVAAIFPSHIWICV